MTPGPPAHQSDDRCEPAQGVALAAAGRDDKVSPATLFPVSYLFCQDGLVALRRHPLARQDTQRLDRGGGADDDDGVAQLLAAGLEQQRYVQYNDGAARSRLTLQEVESRKAHLGVKDCFEPGERDGVIEYALGKALPVDRTVPGNTGECRLDSGDRSASPTEQPMNRRIRIMDRDPEQTEHARRGRFAHADGAGQTKNHHVSRPRISRRARIGAAPGSPPARCRTTP